jgi:hypothetical protein
VNETPDPKRPRGRSTLIALVGWGCFALVAAISCEVGARLDDWFFDDIPILDNPTYESLFVVDDSGLKFGRPGARWKKVVMNNLGMRGADVGAGPTPGCARWMFLGASETFGDPAIAAAEFPARVRAFAPVGRCIETLNTAYAGLPPRALLHYYEAGMAQYAPEVVFIYPSTHFYLASEVSARRPEDMQSRKPKPRPPATGIVAWLERLRFYERLRDSAEIPVPIQKRRLTREIDSATIGKPANWTFSTVPAERLDFMADDMAELVRLIRASGAEPVLMTHAVRVANPPREEDRADLFSMRVYVPRASEEVIAAFEYAAAERTRQLARTLNVRLIDAAGLLNGRRDRFVDLVHFSPAGHDDVAHLILDTMDASAVSHAVH